MDVNASYLAGRRNDFKLFRNNRRRKDKGLGSLRLFGGGFFFANREFYTRLLERIQTGNQRPTKAAPKIYGRYRYEFEVVKGKSSKLKRVDTWPEIDNRGVELFEFIRSQLQYTEQELREKPVGVFFDILGRANTRAEQIAKMQKRSA